MVIRDTEITRAKLLDAAFWEIYRHGFQTASIAGILRDTGLTKGALYHHFPTKQALGLAVIDEALAALFEERIFRPLRDSAHPVATLLEIIASRAGIGDEVVALGCPLNNLMQEMSPLEETFRERLNALYEAWRNAIEDALRRGQTAGEIRTGVDCRAASLFIVSAWEGCVGVAKSLQSPAGLDLCLGQLQSHIRSLAPT